MIIYYFVLLSLQVVRSNTLKTLSCQPWIENLQWTSLQTQLELSVLLC